MEDKHLKEVYPIAWSLQSQIINDFIDKWNLHSEDNLLVADFASGEYDRVPSFFTRELPKLKEIKMNYEKRIVIYCTDVHALRLDGLLSKLEDDNILDNVRLVHAGLETMDMKAKLLDSCIEYISEYPETAIWLDDFLIGEEQFPPECFDIGILNNDVVGYLFEYYTEYSNAEKALQMVWKMIRPGGLLIVTMPCLQYKMDNVTILEKIGFIFDEGLDITLSSGSKNILEKNVPLDVLSNLGHYTFLIFSKS